MPKFSHAQYDELVNDTIRNILELSQLKGGEYARNDDRLDNFRRNALANDVPMETVWSIYAGKHWDAVQTYVLDVIHGNTRQRSESILGRADDLIVYLLLFKAMVIERTTTVVAQESADPSFHGKVSPGIVPNA